MLTRSSFLTVLPFLAALAVIGPGVAPLACAQEWPRFRGPNGSGVSGAKRLPVSWTDKELLWKVKLAGVGHSSPVFWGDKAFLTSGNTSGDGKSATRIVQCLDRRTGQELWRRDFPTIVVRQHAHNSLASATPAVDERHVYLLWASPKDYLVMALDHDGAEKWRVDLGGFQSGHGFGVSPIVHDDLLIVTHEHGGKSALLGLDRASGKERWRVERKSKTTYSTPCVFTPPGRPAEIIFANYEHGMTSVSPKDGRVNWELDVFDKGHMETSIASPIVAGDLVIGASGWLGVRKEVIAVRPGTGPAKPEKAYTLVKGSPLVPTPLAKDDLLFTWEDEGVVVCADVKTGKVHWRERVPGEYYSSPIWAAGHLYNVTREGDVVVVQASSKFQHVATNSLGEGSHASPAAVGDTLYLRTFQHLIAIRARP